MFTQGFPWDFDPGDTPGKKLLRGFFFPKVIQTSRSKIPSRGLLQSAFHGILTRGYTRICRSMHVDRGALHSKPKPQARRGPTTGPGEARVDFPVGSTRAKGASKLGPVSSHKGFTDGFRSHPRIFSSLSAACSLGNSAQPSFSTSERSVAMGGLLLPGGPYTEYCLKASWQNNPGLSPAPEGVSSFLLHGVLPRWNQRPTLPRWAQQWQLKRSNQGFAGQ